MHTHIKKKTFLKITESVVQVESNTCYVYLVGDEGQKARKHKQEVFPTLETVFTKLQLLSYFDQHQVTSQVAIPGCFTTRFEYFSFLKNLEQCTLSLDFL